MADELDAGNALQGDPTDIVIEAGEVVTPVPEPENPDPIVENPPEPVREHGNKGKTPWYMERISAETNRRQQAEEQLAQKSREAEEARQLLERMQNGDKPPTPRSDGPQDVEARAEALAAQKVLYRESREVRFAGIREYPDFSDSLKVLTSVGATGDEFVQDLIDTDKANAHKLIDFLAKDPDRALELVNMPSKQRIAQLTRISMSELNKPVAAPAVPKVAAPSKVPPPRPVVEASRPPEDTPEDEMTDAQWSAWRKKQMSKTA